MEKHNDSDSEENGVEMQGQREDLQIVADDPNDSDADYWRHRK